MSAKRRPKYRPGFDNLDGRILLSSTYNLTKGNLYENNAGQVSLLATHVNSFQVTSNDTVVYLQQNGILFEKPAVESAQLLDRLVNSFQIVSATQVNVVDWFNRDLSNTGICNLTRGDFTRDDSITFSDMRGIFDEVLQSGAVTSTEVQDLRTLLANPSILNMPGSVQNLAGKVLNPTANDVNYLKWYYAGAGQPVVQRDGSTRHNSHIRRLRRPGPV
jgi:hypothetical protein